jgi:putative endonuclease
MAWVYLLECSDGSYYCGSTTDLARRIWQHNEGLGAAYTRRRRPVKVAWAAEFDRVDEAFAFEKRVQRWGRAKRAALIEGRTDDLAALSARSHAARRFRADLGGTSSRIRLHPSSSRSHGRAHPGVP